MDKAKILKIVKRQEFIVAAFSLLVFIFFSLFSDNFYTPTNLRLILQQYAVNGICVLGISIVIILNGIDLSAGAILGKIRRPRDSLYTGRRGAGHAVQLYQCAYHNKMQGSCHRYHHCH